VGLIGAMATGVDDGANLANGAWDAAQLAHGRKLTKDA
jgi:hypothetical protein